MVQIRLNDNACCGCRMCAEVCETNALGFDDSTKKAIVAEVDDCIACLSCVYLCPSGVIELMEYHAVKNYYRDVALSRRLEGFL